jgi:hypothetical protein
MHELKDDLERAQSARIEAAPTPGSSTGSTAQADEVIAARCIERAHDIAASSPKLFSFTWFRRWASGSDVESAWSALHDAEEALLMILPEATVAARLPDLRAGLSSILAGDGRLEEYTNTIKGIEARKPPPIEPADRERIRVIKSAMNSTSDAAHNNIRNYRNWLLIVAGIASLGLIGAAIAHSADSEFVFIAEKGANTHISADVTQLEAAGALGGLLMAIFALIRLQVTSGPVALPLWLAVVRIPAGAVAAVVGAALLQGKVFTSFVPQDRSGLLAYAFLFGAAPEILLQFLDKKVNAATSAARPPSDPLKNVPKQSSAGSDTSSQPDQASS